MEWLAIAHILGPTPVSEALAVCRRLLDETPNDREIQAEVVAVMASLSAMLGRSAEAHDQMQEAQAIMDATGERIWIVAFWWSFVHTSQGDAEAGERELRPTYESLKTMGEKSHFSSMAHALASVTFAQGRYEEAEALTRECEEASRANDVHSQIHWRSIRAKVLSRRGAFAEAEVLAREAIAIAERSDFLLGARGRAHADSPRSSISPDARPRRFRRVEGAIALYEREGESHSGDRRASRARAPQARLSELGQPRTVCLARCCDAERERLEQHALVRRMGVAVRQREPGHDGRDPTGGERGGDRQGASGPHDQRPSTKDPLERVAGQAEHFRVAGEHGGRREISVHDLERCARRQCFAQEVLGSSSEHGRILARSHANRDPGRGARHERRVPHARLAAEDPRDVERRLDEDALVELCCGALVERRGTDSCELLRSGWQLTPAVDLVLARLRDAGSQRLGEPAVAREQRCQRLRERMDRVQRRPAVVTGVEVALAGAHLDVQRDEPARRDDELGRVPPLHPAVEDDARVRRPVVGREEAVDRVAARLLLAVADDAEGHGERACRRRAPRSPSAASRAGPCRRRRRARRATRRAPRPRTGRSPRARAALAAARRSGHRRGLSALRGGPAISLTTRRPLSRTSASPPSPRTFSATHSAACATSLACAGSALTLGMARNPLSSSSQPGGHVTSVAISDPSAFERKPSAAPVLLAARVVEDVAVPELEQPLRDFDRALALRVRAVDDHESVEIRDPARRQRVDSLRRDVDRTGKVRRPVGDRPQRVDEDELVVTLQPLQELLPPDLDQRRGHAAAIVRAELRLDADDELALATAPGDVERSEPLQQRDDARVVAADGRDELRDAGCARVGGELAREDGPEAPALVCVGHCERNLRRPAVSDEPCDPGGLGVAVEVADEDVVVAVDACELR